MSKVKEIQCEHCNAWHSVKEWNGKRREFFGNFINIENHRDRVDYWFYCPSCDKQSNMEKQYVKAARWRQKLHGMDNTDVITPVDHPGAIDSDMKLVNVLYEQALEQAELRQEIEEALDRGDKAEFDRLVKKYVEDGKRGVSLPKEAGKIGD